MSSKSKVIVLRRLLVGEEDLLLKVYGWGGVMNLFVREGALAQSRYAGIFEPFNVVELTYRQSGEIIIPIDISKVSFLSYLALESYERYLWMCSLAGFFIKWVRYYDKQLFEVFLNYLSIRIKNVSIFFLRFKLDILKAMGLYKEMIFEEDIRSVVRTLSEGRKLLLERMKLDKEIISKIEKIIDAHLEMSL
ncbi:MAG: recombination protein O N-terminal domain-containing protein [Hydrogenobacter sp.]|uniref:recombination protein O N-terminal domain-containing protein n=1 Tax=Hydrogenobacter thermophilus TaxID=940 RepID=UPI0030F9666F